MNRSARCAVVRAVLVALLALIALWSTQAGAAVVTPQGADARPPASSFPVDPAGEGHQDTTGTEQPDPPCRAERRGTQAPRDRQAPVALPRPNLRGAAVPVTPPAPHPTRSVVLRC
ncbi:hypothetical protein [Streptomyces sp. NPDC001970]